MKILTTAILLMLTLIVVPAFSYFSGVALTIEGNVLLVELGMMALVAAGYCFFLYRNSPKIIRRWISCGRCCQLCMWVMWRGRVIGIRDWW